MEIEIFKNNLEKENILKKKEDVQRLLPMIKAIFIEGAYPDETGRRRQAEFFRAVTSGNLNRLPSMVRIKEDYLFIGHLILGSKKKVYIEKDLPRQIKFLIWR